MPYSITPTYGIVKWEKPSSNVNKLNQFCIFESSNKYNFPELAVYNAGIPEKLCNFHDTEVQRLHKTVRNSFIHFFIDDYYFEGVWTNPKHLITLSKGVQGVISPTFSVYEIQPRAMNIWNVYRNRWVCKYLEMQGINVIPSPVWADSSTYDFVFEGLPRDSVLAVSTVGTYKKVDRQLFIDGFEEMLHQLNPRTLLVYGEYFPLKFEDYVDEVYYYPSEWKQRRDRIANKR